MVLFERGRPMSILKQIKQAVGMTDETGQSYNCRECQRTFELTESRMEEISCPNCGSGNIRGING